MSPHSLFLSPSRKLNELMKCKQAHLVPEKLPPFHWPISGVLLVVFNRLLRIAMVFVLQALTLSLLFISLSQSCTGPLKPYSVTMFTSLSDLVALARADFCSMYLLFLCPISSPNRTIKIQKRPVTLVIDQFILWWALSCVVGTKRLWYRIMRRTRYLQQFLATFPLLVSNKNAFFHGWISDFSPTVILRTEYREECSSPYCNPSPHTLTVASNNLNSLPVPKTRFLPIKRHKLRHVSSTKFAELQYHLHCNQPNNGHYLVHHYRPPKPKHFIHHHCDYFISSPVMPFLFGLYVFPLWLHLHPFDLLHKCKLFSSSRFIFLPALFRATM